MKKDKGFITLLITLIVVFILSIISLIFAEQLEAAIAVVGIRIAVLIVSFAAFGASAIFSMMVYKHNITASKINDDSNKRSEMFRELQFASSNYSIIEFNDRMLIYQESDWYIPKFYSKDIPSFHLVEKGLNPDEELCFYTIRIPYRLVEGKTAGKIELSNIRFERNQEIFNFIPMEHENLTRAYLLFNDHTKRNNMIVNIVFNKSSNFFKDELNLFSKIKIKLTVSSVLGVSIDGMSELYFTNPTQTEGEGLHTYKINSSNFIVTSPPYLDEDLLKGIAKNEKQIHYLK